MTCARAFTLIELLVVVAVLSMLLALILPTLHTVRRVAKRTQCQSNIRQIALAWDVYLNDYEQQFCQGNNMNHDYGGWQGDGAYALWRPLNPYVNLPARLSDRDQATLFRCPADSGGLNNRPPEQEAYDYFGNSYQTNLLLIGPNQLPVPPGDLGILFSAINRKIATARRTEISDPARLILLGDNNWATQWWSAYPEGSPWHGKKRGFNMAFLDGHVALQRIEKGLFLAQDYRILPFAELDPLIPEVRALP